MSGPCRSGAWVRVAERVYRCALHRYPKSLRARYGHRMAQDFRALLEEEIERDGLSGWYRGCLRGFRDLLRPLPARPGGGVGNRTRTEGASLRFGLRLRLRLRGGRSAAGRFVAALAEDVRAAVRSLARRPSFTFLVVGVLGLGIALNTSIFALIDAYLLRPLPYPDAERLVQVRPATPAVGWTNSRDVFERAVAWDLGVYTIVGDAEPEIAFGARVSPDFFDLYGVRPVVGRAFAADETGQGGPSVALTSHDLWMRRWAGDLTIVGRTFSATSSEDRRGRESYTVVGVLLSDFWYFNRYVDMLVPLREPHSASIARLRPDVPRARAEEILTGRALSDGSEHADDIHVSLVPLQRAYTADIRPRLFTLQGGALRRCGVRRAPPPAGPRRPHCPWGCSGRSRTHVRPRGIAGRGLRARGGHPGWGYARPGVEGSAPQRAAQ